MMSILPKYIYEEKCIPTRRYLTYLQQKDILSQLKYHLQL